MNQTRNQQLKKLLEKGVKIPNPESVEIGHDVSVDRISGNGTTIHSGSKILGASTLILDHVIIGHESPATVSNCHIAPGVELKGGYFSGAVFLKNARAGSGAHVREGTILEEEASIAHTVGLKQTILFPFVTLGSLINFCDCLMSGGTGRKNHSEVGSSFIHFNYTPNQDKATASLLGDVPRGVMLDWKPIFLGGQGGVVGPCRLAYGTVTAAGTICRKDELREDRLIFGGPGTSGNLPYSPGGKAVKRTVTNNLVYIANLIALMRWYEHVRSLFIDDAFPEALLSGMKDTLALGINERMNRLKGFLERIIDPGTKWAEIERRFQSCLSEKGDERLMSAFINAFKARVQGSGKDYVGAVKDLPAGEKKTGTAWLQTVVDQVVGNMEQPVIELMKRN